MTTGRLRSAGLLAATFAIVCRGNLLGQITEFTIPTAGSAPEGIATGPDGNLWFTESSGNKIGRVTTVGAIDEFEVPTPGSSPWGITAGPDGNLWFTERLEQNDFGGKIGRITPDGVITEFDIPTAGSCPGGITAGPDGNLWFVEICTYKVGRITPAGVVTEFPVPPTQAASGPEFITPGSDGNLWYTGGANNKIGRVTLAGEITEFTSFGYPFGIVAGPDGNLWFTEFDGGRIGRITTDGVVTEFLSGLGLPYGIVAGPDGNLWFTERGSNGVWRLTTAGIGSRYTTPTAGSHPHGITAGPDGALWFAEFAVNKIGTMLPPLAPTVDGIAPSSGPAAAGTSIAVSGNGFQLGATVTIVTPATDVVVVNSTLITATVPARYPGTLNDVVIENPDLSVVSLPKGWMSDFRDVPQSDPQGFHDYIEKIFRAEITAGVGNGFYGIDQPVTRAQMAVFLLKTEHGSGYAPPPCQGFFADVPCPSTPDFPYSDWIEELYDEQITSGCLPLGNYCPDQPVTRAQMAVFLLKAEHGSNYVPPACLNLFEDVPCPATQEFPYSDWIEQLFNEEITAGCQPIGNYCPDDSVTRGQMAVFLVRTFGL
jgi:streptogramin lyase